MADDTSNTQLQQLQVQLSRIDLDHYRKFIETDVQIWNSPNTGSISTAHSECNTSMNESSESLSFSRIGYYTSHIDLATHQEDLDRKQLPLTVVENEIPSRKYSQHDKRTDIISKPTDVSKPTESLIGRIRHDHAYLNPASLRNMQTIFRIDPNISIVGSSVKYLHPPSICIGNTMSTDFTLQQFRRRVNELFAETYVSKASRQVETNQPDSINSALELCEQALKIAPDLPSAVALRKTIEQSKRHTTNLQVQRHLDVSLDSKRYTNSSTQPTALTLYGSNARSAVFDLPCTHQTSKHIDASSMQGSNHKIASMHGNNHETTINADASMHGNNHETTINASSMQGDNHETIDASVRRKQLHDLIMSQFKDKHNYHANTNSVHEKSTRRKPEERNHRYTDRHTSHRHSTHRSKDSDKYKSRHRSRSRHSKSHHRSFKYDRSRSRSRSS